MEKKELLTTNELAKHLKVTRSTLWRWEKEGMPYLKIGDTKRYELDCVLEWFKNKQNKEE